MATKQINKLHSLTLDSKPADERKETLQAHIYARRWTTHQGIIQLKIAAILTYLVYSTCLPSLITCFDEMPGSVAVKHHGSEVVSPTPATLLDFLTNRP